MPKSPTKRRPATVAALTESALALFAERGFHATSISDIVQQAGLTRGAFYSNFQDKEELFLALYDAHTDRLLAELREQVAACTDDPDPLARMFDQLATHDARERSWFLVSMEFTLHAARHPETARALAEHEERLNAGLAELLARGLESAGHTPEVAPTTLARLVVALFEGLTAMRVTHTATDPAPLARRALPHLVRALSTPHGSPGTP
ncbi:TetR/AcrR family transcriptional regulator [Streptomyces sp. NPDC048644]|uniref:TetR/AcrR family transcriptional regulator n=1 Tax=Streptomyces sp. NPDC048644 TaxID=3365582 RepID=UPI0037104947